MRQRLLNVTALAVIALGGAFLLTNPVPASANTTPETVAECGSSSGECCCSMGDMCFCGPCEVLIEACF